MLDKLTAKAKEALEAARQDCLSAERQQLLGQHLLKALLSQEGSAVPMVLGRLGEDPGQAGALTDAVVDWIDPDTGILQGGSDPRKDGAALGY